MQLVNKAFEDNLLFVNRGRHIRVPLLRHFVVYNLIERAHHQQEGIVELGGMFLQVTGCFDPVLDCLKSNKRV